MMNTVLIATLGKRPEAITISLDALQRQIAINQVAIVHTDELRSGIREALQSLQERLQGDYPHIQSAYHSLRQANGAPLVDVIDRISAEAYLQGVRSVLEDYKRAQMQVHLLVAGGRKAMSIYAALAAAHALDGLDHLWTTLTPDHLMKLGRFHLPPGQADQVRLVPLPGLMLQRTSVDNGAALRLRTAFIESLSPKEREVARALAENPYARDRYLAETLGKSVRTIQNQLASIYHHLEVYLNVDARQYDIRHLLVDLLRGRLEELHT